MRRTASSTGFGEGKSESATQSGRTSFGWVVHLSESIAVRSMMRSKS